MTTMLRVAVAMCFLCHGIVALRASTLYYAEWNVWLQQLFPAEDRFLGARVFLSAAGAIDLVIACCLVSFARAPRVVLLWACAWALATATARIYFLASASADIWLGVVTPLAEFLVRAPNWVAALLCLRWKSAPRWSAFAVAAVLVGLVLHAAADAHHPRHPAELAKLGASDWAFVASALAPVAALIALRARRFAPLVLIGVAVPELFHLVYRAWPAGALNTALQIGEHAAVYWCFALVYLQLRQRGDRRESWHGGAATAQSAVAPDAA